MKKVIISAVISILTVCVAHAQDVKFGFRGGLNLPNIMTGNNDTPVSQGYTSRMATGAGIFTELQLNQIVSLRLGVEYSEMGGKKDGMQAMPAKRLVTEIGNSIGTGITNQQLAVLEALAANMPQYYYANVNNTVKFDYIMLPLMVQLGKNIGQSPWRMYINTGPFVSFFLSGKQLAKGTSKLYSDVSGTTTLWDNMPTAVQDIVAATFPDMEQKLDNPVPFGTTNITEELKSTNFGITGNLGIRYQYRRSYFFIEAGGNYGFVTVQNDSANGNNRIGAASIMAGYAFSLF
jgi:hypothetical protein